MKRKGAERMKWFKEPIILIKTALSVSYVAVFLFFFAVVGSIMFYTSERMVTNNTKQLAHQEVEEVQQTMNTYLSEMKTLASSLAYNPNILKYVKTVSDMEAGEVNWKQQLNCVITGSLMKEKGIHSIGVFPIGESEGIYFGDTSMQSVYQIEKMYPQYDILEKTGCEYLSELGVLVVNLKTLYLNNILSKYGMAGHLCLVDETGHVIAQNKSGESPVDEIVGELYQSDANDMVRIIDGVKYVVSFDTLSVTNWKMVGLIPIQSLQDNVRHGQMLMTLSMIVGAVIVITLSLIIASKISKPIAKLTEGMKAVQNDRLDIRIEDHTFLETKWLSEGFNGMLDDINELLINSYQQELMERDIRLEALQAKISPHFLYNTLETINALLILDENYETSKLVFSLAAYGIARLKIPGRNFLIGYSMLGMSFSAFMYIVPLYYNFSEMGLVNTHASVIIIYAASYISFSMLLIRTFLVGIPRELEEAGKIDGCSEFGVFLHVTMPLSLPILATVALIVFVWCWNEFLWANTFLTTDDIRTVSTRFYKFVGEWSRDLAKIYTVGMIALGPIIVLYLCLQKNFIEGLTQGGIKG